VWLSKVLLQKNPLVKALVRACDYLGHASDVDHLDNFSILFQSQDEQKLM
jgi:hypothetical protein